MKTKITRLICFALLTGNAFAQEIPKGWFKAGSKPGDYSMTVDHETFHGGKGSALVKSTADKPGGFGTLMQTFKADEFLGKRVRLSGYVRSQDVADWAGLWMRVDGPRGEPLAFDNMQKRAIKGSGDWTKYEIVLDVPDSAQQIAFGLLLTGKGSVWMDDLSFEVVGKDVPTTGETMAKESTSTYVNLDFED
ncbi:MAG TPA: hypothetical protein VKV04_11645 [Verrucomicrobiae bacterium]|nr:hypothetical protein [Verrucomicrobiae bacterium]